ncbi:MAG TPA: hypothetical protein VF621_09880 [Pyrinomonadaceae bacterium]
MPVIGRLDGQVEEVIISPISRRGREEENPPAARKNEETSAPSDPPDRAPSQTTDPVESSGEAGELPVWLL